MQTEPTLVIETATRTGVIPLIGVYGKSGSGKTHSALLLARGLAGPDRDIAIVDTESGRSGILVDLIPGPVFKQVKLEPPFNPSRYIMALDILEKANIGAAVVDSMTHEWSGEGGILEWQDDELERMAGDNYQKREACKMAAWIKPKAAHKLMVQRILRAKIPLVCCLRADEKTHIDKKDGEKTRVITDDFTTPDFDKKFVFEMLINFETVVRNGKPGCVNLRKWSHPDLQKVMPLETEQIGVKHGEAIAAWCLGTAKATPPPKSKPSASKKELWTLTKSIHNGNAKKLEAWMLKVGLIGEDEAVETLSEERFVTILKLARNHFSK